MPPALTRTSTIAPDLSQGFDSDWSKAQDNYKAAINGGFSAEDADRTYLAPIKAKYEIIRSSPSLLNNSAALNQFNSDYDNGVEQYQKLYNSYSRDGGDWAASQTIKPLLDKWTLKASLPTATVPTTTAQVTKFYANNPAMQAEQQEAQKQIQSGMNPVDVLTTHPTLLKYAPYREQFQPIYRSALIQDRRNQAAVLAKENPSVEKIVRVRSLLQKAITDDPNMPPDVKKSYMENIGALDEKLKSSVPPDNSAPSLSPPAQPMQPTPEAQPDDSGLPDLTGVPASAPVQPAAPITPKDKVALANQIAQQHPSWTKDQVILAVEGKLKGALPDRTQ